jgi:hypothetical protein
MIIYIQDRYFSNIFDEIKHQSSGRRVSSLKRLIMRLEQNSDKDEDKPKKKKKRKSSSKKKLKKKTKSFTGAYLRGITSSLRGDNPNGAFGDLRDTDGGVKGAVQGASTGILNGAWKGGLIGLGAGAVVGAITGDWSTIPEWGLKGAGGIAALGGIAGTVNGFRGRDYKFD